MIRLTTELRPQDQANHRTHRRDCLPMSKPSLSLETNKQICEADGCFAIAEEEIKISVGRIGKIDLSVCAKCKPKFIINSEITLEQIREDLN
jgi:hypothetical protein